MWTYSQCFCTVIQLKAMKSWQSRRSSGKLKERGKYTLKKKKDH